MSRLVVVESPSKAKKIGSYLGRGWTVLASMGHVRDLPPKALGVDVANRFEPTYHVLRGKGKTIQKLRAAAQKAEAIYLATDPDREGEAIAWHVLEAIGNAAWGKPVYRVVFHEITPRAIRAAFERPRPLDQALVDSQQARRVLDRLVGWKVSPVLSRAFGTSLSAGRVQSVAVRLVTERELEIERFVPEQFWTLEAQFARRTREREGFVAQLSAMHSLTDREYDPKRLTTERVHALASELSRPTIEWQVLAVESKESRRAPPPPFVTSTLQQKASSALGMAPKRAMQVAQALYEKGLITYMRTDSPAVAPEAQQAAREVIASIFGRDTLPARPPFYRARGNAQEAHECIRPTEPKALPKAQAISGQEAALYRLIWMRFIASQMAPALYDLTIATIEPSEGGASLPYHFQARGRVLRDAGWLLVYGVRPGAGDDEEEGEEDEQILPPLLARELVDLEELAPREHWTKPPPRYTEPSLIKALEKEGIGRPSTYAAIMDTIQQRGYVERKGKSLVPTEAGRVVTAFLTRHFPDLLDVGFTRQLEEDLDRVAEGGVAWTALLDGFYAPLEERIGVARQVADGIPVEESLAEPCPECSARLEERYSKYGRYRICESCGFKPGSPSPTGLSCPECGKELVRRRSKYGPFLGCAGYPECKYTEKQGGERGGRKRTTRRGSRKGSKTAPAVAGGSGQPCPECGKPLVERQGRYGAFLGCSGFPTCRYTHRG